MFVNLHNQVLNWICMNCLNPSCINPNDLDWLIQEKGNHIWIFLPPFTCMTKFYTPRGSAHSDKDLNGQTLITFSCDYGVFFVLWVKILLYAESKIYLQIIFRGWKPGRMQIHVYWNFKESSIEILNILHVCIHKMCSQFFNTNYTC